MVNSFFNNKYIEYESNGDTNGDWSLNEYLKTYMRNIIIDLQSSNTWKIQWKNWN